MPNLPKDWTPMWGGSTKKTSTPTAPSGNNTLQARLDRAKAEGGNKVLIANLEKQLGISPSQAAPVAASQAPTDPYGNLTGDQAQFEKGWDAYTKAQQGVLDIETQRGIQQYDQKLSDQQLQASRNREDYAKYTGDQQSQMNKQLGNSSKDFARKLAAASSAYGQRGILRSGIAKQQIGDATTDFVDNQTYFKTQSQRQMEAGQKQYDRQYADNQTDTGRIQTAKKQYTDDREVAKQVLDTKMKYDGDTQYNQFQTQQWATQQTENSQAVTRMRTGTTANPSLRTWRVGGNYTR
jgi:hypothetical protein